MNMPAEAPRASVAEEERTGLDKEALKRAFLESLFYMQGKFPALATTRDCYLALAYVVRDRLLQRGRVHQHVDGFGQQPTVRSAATRGVERTHA